MLETFRLVTAAFNDNLAYWLAVIAIVPLVLGFLVVRHLRKVKQDVQRRVMADPGAFAATQLGAKARITARAARTMEAMAKVAGADNLKGNEAKELRTKLMQVGLYDQRAVLIYFGLRIFCAGALGLMFFVIAVLSGIFERMEFLIAYCLAAAMIGYFVPTVILSRRIDKCQTEHRAGFPDFMDLMVVCAQAGLSMEAGIQKIGRELTSAYPSLARNLEFTSIEIRSGKTLSQSIESLGRRLGIEEAKSFATLLSQSEELGSSLTQSLRAYSDDMRNKRLMKAEEKAFSLPAKLVVPLTLFVFPTLLVVLLLPIVISVSSANL